MRTDMETMSTAHHQVNSSRLSRARLRLPVLIIQSALIAASASLMAHGTRTARDTQARPSWTLDEDSWNQWWSYSGVSGPSYWGLLNSDWFMCDKGRRQSPIDLNTKALVYDPHLRPLRADNNLISGVLYNDGHSIVFNGSVAALARFVSIEEQKTKHQQQQQTEPRSDPPKGAHSAQEDGDNVTSTSATHTISRRDASSRANELFKLDKDPAQGFELADSGDGFVVEAPGGAEGGLSAPFLMEQLSNNVDLSISESGRLQSETAISELQRQLRSDSQAEASDSFEEADPMGAYLAPNAAGSLHTSPGSNRIHFTGASSAYSYRFEALQLKFGAGGQTFSSSASHDGSEHQIDGRSFAAELQLFAYNWQLYRSYDESLTRPYGLLGISILVDLVADTNKSNNEPLETSDQKSSSPEGASSNSTGNNGPTRTQASNEQLERLLVSATDSLNHRGAFVSVHGLNISALLPETDQFVTYEGSLTQPGCHESVTWLILNRPLYISKQILDKLRSISADELSAPNPTGTLLAGNTRPTQPANNRPIRTNISPPTKSAAASNKPLQGVACPRLWTRYEYTRQAS